MVEQAPVEKDPLVNINCPNCNQQLMLIYSLKEMQAMSGIKLKDTCPNCNTGFQYWYSKARGVVVKKI